MRCPLCRSETRRGRGGAVHVYALARQARRRLLSGLPTYGEALNVAGVQQKPRQAVMCGAAGATQQILARSRIRRDAAAMLYWALRWHEGRRVSYRALSDLLWGEFALQPRDPAPSLRELMVYVQKRHGDKWAIDDCGRGFRISPQSRTV